jgi:hypothetical protein
MAKAMVGLAGMVGEEEFTATSFWGDGRTLTVPYTACKYSAYRIFVARIQFIDIRWICGAFL